MAISVLAPLPLALARFVFALLPVDSRARAACVCRGWRDLLADPLLWTRLDLVALMDRDMARGAANADALVQGATRRAKGHLRELDVSAKLPLSPIVLLAVVAANAGSLRELRVSESNVFGYEDTTTAL